MGGSKTRLAQKKPRHTTCMLGLLQLSNLTTRKEKGNGSAMEPAQLKSPLSYMRFDLRIFKGEVISKSKISEVFYMVGYK